MKAIFPVLLLIIGQLYAQDQQDPYAKKFLDKTAEKTKTYTSIQADFELEITDRKENNTSTSKGSIIIKGDKYRVETLGNTVYFNGTTMWSHTQDLNEVIITEPDKDDDDFLSNPAKILSWYNRDFKYRYVRETKNGKEPVHEIDLFPKNLKQPYTRIKILLNKETMLISSVSSIGKDGIDYAVKLSGFVLNKDLNDQLFEFDVNKFRNLEVIDMRF